MPTEHPSITVLGSVNLDFVAKVREFPRPGETVTNAVLHRHPGGKGANQALAARRLGARVSLVASVGTDAAADEALVNLRREGVDLTFVRRLPEADTGIAMILVAAGGENQIVVAPGANALMQPENLRLPPADAVIAQLEIPTETLVKAAEIQHGRFCLNAAPARPVPERLLALTDLLVVNEIEAETLGPRLDRYDGLLAITYGRDGAVLRQRGQELARARAPSVNSVDSTGAGDAFMAALTFFLLHGLKPAAALQKACIAGALATTRAGAQSSPTLDEIEHF